HRLGAEPMAEPTAAGPGESQGFEPRRRARESRVLSGVIRGGLFNEARVFRALVLGGCETTRRVTLPPASPPATSVGSRPTAAAPCGLPRPAPRRGRGPAPATPRGRGSR